MSAILGNAAFFDAHDVEQVEAYFPADDKIPMSTGAPRFPVPGVIKRAIAEDVARQRFLSYPPLEGTPALREAVARFHRQRLGLPHQADHVLVTYGAMQALYDVVATLCTAGDEVLIPAPFWFQFPHIVTQTGAVPRAIETVANERFKLTPRRLDEAITPRTKLLFFTNPNNPTGTVYSRQELAALAEVLLAAKNRHVTVVSDEVYNLLLLGTGGGVPAAPSIGSFPSLAARVITINSLSKNQAVSGLRVGYLAAADIAPFRARQRFSTLGVNVYLQAGAAAALDASQQIVGDIVETLDRRLSRAMALLGTIARFRFEKPQSAYYLWVDMRGYIGCRTPGDPGTEIRSDVELAEFLDTDARVAVVTGTSCGTPGYFRVTFAIEEALFAEGVRRMQRSLAKLRC